MSGTLYLVGTGPGDPELLTLKAVRVIGEADVVAYPQKPGDTSLSYRIAAAYIGADAEHLPADIPMTRARAPGQAAYDDLAAEILTRLQAGKQVTYLCEGDPMFYGSAMYVLARIAHEAPVVVVPGITSLTATAAAIARPLAARNEVLKVLPAPLDDDALRAELEGAEAVAIIKIGRHFDRIRKLLEQTGHAPSAIIIEHATGADEVITPLREFANDARPYFSTILCYRGAEAWAL